MKVHFPRPSAYSVSSQSTKLAVEGGLTNSVRAIRFFSLSRCAFTILVICSRVFFLHQCSSIRRVSPRASRTLRVRIVAPIASVRRRVRELFHFTKMTIDNNIVSLNAFFPSLANRATSRTATQHVFKLQTLAREL